MLDELFNSDGGVDSVAGIGRPDAIIKIGFNVKSCYNKQMDWGLSHFFFFLFSYRHRRRHIVIGVSDVV